MSCATGAAGEAPRYLLALDQGTTSSRAILFGADGRPRGAAQKEFPQQYPQPGWVEHDPLDLWSSQLSVVAEVLGRTGVKPSQLAAIGITNQRETTLIWDRATLQPIHNAIVWQDRRTAQAVERLRADGAEELVRNRTGLLLDPYFSATKIAWLLDNVPGARKRAEAGELAFGTVDSWLTAQLTAGREHVTDLTNASRTQLLNIHTGDWDEDLLALFGVPRELLPEVVPSSGVIVEASYEPLIGVPLAGLAGDQQAATFGQACFAPGQAKSTYGTGCFLMMNTGANAERSVSRLLTTPLWQLGAAAPEYGLEGSIFMAGAVVQWLRDGLGVIREAADVERLALSVSSSDDVMFVPAMTGLGAPHWDPYARGTILGISRGTTAAHIARAALEGIALQVADVVEAMERDSNVPLAELRVDGGAASNDLLMQLQADLLGVTVVRPEVTETTALGAAYLAGLAVGVWPDQATIGEMWREERRFEPTLGDAEREAVRARWRKAIERAAGWSDPT